MCLCGFKSVKYIIRWRSRFEPYVFQGPKKRQMNNGAAVLSSLLLTEKQFSLNCLAKSLKNYLKSLL